jgi:hypothetical protein
MYLVQEIHWMYWCINRPTKEEDLNKVKFDNELESSLKVVVDGAAYLSFVISFFVLLISSTNVQYYQKRNDCKQKKSGVTLFRQGDEKCIVCIGL